MLIHVLRISDAYSNTKRVGQFKKKLQPQKYFRIICSILLHHFIAMSFISLSVFCFYVFIFYLFTINITVQSSFLKNYKNNLHCSKQLEYKIKMRKVFDPTQSRTLFVNISVFNALFATMELIFVLYFFFSEIG